MAQERIKYQGQGEMMITFILGLVLLFILLAALDSLCYIEYYENWNPDYYFYIWDELFETVSWLTPDGVWHYQKQRPFEVQIEDLRKRNFKVFERQLEYFEKKLFEGCAVPKKWLK